MARKIDRNAKPAPVQDTGADDLNVLAPDMQLVIGDRTLTVREYRFMEGLRVRAKARPLIDDLEAFVKDGAAVDAGVEDYVELLAKHSALVRELIADSVQGIDADWIEALDDADGQVLLLTWWGVCGRFFVRVVAARLRDRLLAQARRVASAGPTSSPSLPQPDTAPLQTSESATPSVS